MYKSYFHNGKLTKETIEKKVSPHTSIISPKKIVDINKLLNRVKLEKKNKKKENLILVGMVCFITTIIVAISII
ncbi:hypothetical protein VP91_00009620 [Candidatus Pelagibacter ubique]|uniref:Uncharacterized protein n=1 Tax=Pelagibacter ubique TaxID=198252 RepID=A0ABX1T117_PELUQ|nr:hypothetical protein [Candidatus Pelagibacter ubique]NMN67813.1 hypothetical protein [Candidatus Pelagibacter ubique]